MEIVTGDTFGQHIYWRRLKIRRKVRNYNAQKPNWSMPWKYSIIEKKAPVIDEEERRRHRQSKIFVEGQRVQDDISNIWSCLFAVRSDLCEEQECERLRREIPTQSLHGRLFREFLRSTDSSQSL